MDCNEAQNAMMHYIEKSLKPTAALSLHRHVLGCTPCREVFTAMDAAAEEMNAPDYILTEAPGGFVNHVMTKIKSLPAHRPLPVSTASEPETAGDIWLRVVWSLFAMCMGIGFIIMHNEESISAFLLAHTRLAAVEGWITPVAMFFETMTQEFLSIGQAFIGQAAQTGEAMTNAGSILLIIAGLLAAALIYTVRKEKLNV